MLVLAKLRRRFHRIKSAFEDPSRGIDVNQVIATGLEENPGGFNWIGIDALVEALGRDAKTFQPLASAIAKLSACIKRLETYPQVPSGYSEIRINMNDLLLKLFGLLNDSESCAIKQGRTANLARSIESETESLLQLVEDWSDVMDTGDVERQANEVLGRFRRLQTLMGHFIGVVLDRLLRSTTALNRLPDPNALPRTTCAENTRVDVLHNIKGWIRHGNNRQVYWLSGMAGSGKTTIAYTLCDHLKNSGYPTASYFCMRRLPTYRKANLILLEVSRQLSLLSRPFLCALHDAISPDAVVQNLPIHDQFKRLIAMPLRRVGHTFPAHPVVVIDALDECEDRAEVNDMLKTLLAYATELPIKFVLTSRRGVGTIDYDEILKRDQALTEQSLDGIFHLHVQEDIRTYLASELQDLDLSPNELERLTEQPGGLFRDAAWFVDYILAGGRPQARERMLRLLDVFWDCDGDGRTDAIYEAILDAMLSEDFHGGEELAEIKTVLHLIICARLPFTTGFLRGVLAKLPDLRLTMPLENALQALHPVLLVPSMDGLLTPRYKSLQRYVMDQKRSGKHHYNAKTHGITQLTLRHFDTIQSPHPPYNICNLPSSYLRDGEAPRIEKQIKSAISHDLLDACRQWGVYLELSQPCEELVDALYEFLSSRLLLWMEVLNMKQCMHEGLGQLRRARAWLKGVEGSNSIQIFLEDAERFVGTFWLSPLSEHTPHIYVSMLPLWPKDRLVSQHYMQQISGSVKLKWTQREKGSKRAYWVGSSVQCMAYSPSSRYCIAVGIDDTIQILDIWTQELIGQPFKGHAHLVNSVAYSPDGARIASGSDDGTVRVWDAHTGQPIGQPLRGHTGSIQSVAYSPDGAYIVSGSKDKTIRIWDAQTRQPTGQLQGHTDWVNSVAYSPDGAHIVSGSSDKVIHIWEARTGQPIGQPLQGHTSLVNSVACSPDGAHIVSGSSDETIRIWDAHTGQPIGQPLQGHTGWVQSVAYSPDGAHIVSGSSDEIIRIWDAQTVQPMARLQGHTGWVNSVAYSPDGAHIVSGSSDKVIHIWDAHTRQSTGQPLLGHTNRVESVAYSPDGTHIVSGSLDNTIRIWDAQTGQPYIGQPYIGQPLQGRTHLILSVAYSPDGAHIASGSSDNTIRIWDAHTGQPIGQPLRGHTQWVNSVAYSPDGAHIVSGSLDNTIRIWDTHTMQPIRHPLWYGYTHLVLSVAYSPDGAHIVSGLSDAAIHIWDAHTGQPIGQPLQGHTDWVNSVAYSPDGAHIASGSDDETIRIWDVHTGKPIGQPLRGHTGSIQSVTYSPDGAHIASGSSDNTIRIWDAHTGQPTGQLLQAHTSSVQSVAYSPDGAHIVSGSSDNTIRIWDTGTIPPEDWRLNEDGWVVDSNGLRLVWIPSGIRAQLVYHPTQLIIFPTGPGAYLDLSDARLGEDWARCFDKLPARGSDISDANDG
ncbi:hypothetical protein FRC09_016579 [Ceratobasidium sp. 395]|nr:hypothetical protein FRC09_016579 [Ceratobasidium sp. 395]